MMQSQHINEILIEQRRWELDHINRHTIEAREGMREHDGLRRHVASALVRLGMTLDHEAGVRAAHAR